MNKKTFLAAALTFLLGGASAWALDEVDGVYQINNGEDLVAFSELVNGGERTANAVLTADIDMTEYSEQFAPIGTDDFKYSGTFDGQTHKISNLKIYRDHDYVGLFGVIETPAHISNIVLDATCHLETTKAYCAVVGVLRGSKGPIYLENIGMEGEVVLGGKNGGGILGNNMDNAGYPNLKNCYMTGTVSAGSNSALLIGYAGDGGSFIGCWGTGEVLAGLGSDDNYFIRSASNTVIEGCYSKNGSQGTVGTLTEEMLSSGELCYGLNGNQSVISWYQNIGTDPVPVLDATHAIVYTTAPLRCDGKVIGDGDYTNDASKASKIPDHQYVDGVCTECGLVQEGFMEPDEEGFYNIKNASELAWFSTFVSIGGNTEVNARILADIDMAEYSSSFVPIGSDANRYKGTFDGQGHRISNLNINLTQNYVGFFGVIQAPAAIRNLIIDETCTIEGTGDYCGFVAAIKGGNKADVYLENLGMEGSIILTGKDGGGILGNNQDNAAYPRLKNCYVTGNISGGSSSAVLVGYAGDGGSYEGCWGNGQVLTGLDGDNNYFIRSASNSTIANCFSKYGSTANVTILEDSWLETGELCYRLNGKSFENPGFYQRIGEDLYPVFDSSHGIVYKNGDGYGSVYDDATFADFQSAYLWGESEYAESVLAEQACIVNYTDALQELEGTQNMDEFMEKYFEIQPVKDLLKSSASAYATYQATMEDIIAYLDEHDDFFGEKREYLESYLSEYIEPDDEDYPVGSYAYIVENHELSEADIKAETEKILTVRDEAIAEGFDIHSDITKMLTNYDFSNGYNGWEGQTGSGTNSPVAECKNKTCDYYQTITDLRNGVYELQLNGFFRPGNATSGDGNLTSTNYGAFLYTNDIQNYFMAAIEDMIAVEDAVDGENCMIGNDKVVYNEDGEEIGYIPSGQTGFKTAANSGRYSNRVLVNVTDGTLTVGIRVPGTGVANDLLEVGNIKLFYHGTLEDADEQIDATLAGMVARANTIIASVPDGGNYAEYPNFSNEIRAELSKAVDAVAGTTSVEDKYALIEKFSDLFQQVYDSKKEFVSVMDAADSFLSLATALEAFLSEEDIQKIYAYTDQLVEAFLDGTATADMANLDKIGIDTSFLPAMVDGVYQIQNGRELSVFSTLVNSGDIKAKAALIADIDMAEDSESFEPIGNDGSRYAGIFDGQGHKISNLTVKHEGDYAGLFGVVQTPAIIRNVVLDATCHLETTGNYCGVVGAIKGSKGDVYLENIGMEGEVVLGGKNGGGILGNNQDNAAYPRLKNCYMTGTVSANTNSALLVGYAGDAGSYDNCWGTGEVIKGLGAQDNYLIRSASNSVSFTNNYSKNGNQSNVTIIQEGWAESGELCYRLNGDQSEIIWYQNIGEDLYPVLDSTHGIVVMDEDGNYVTGVENVIAADTKAQNKVYDLQGRRITSDKLSKGIYVINGKKVLVK